MANKLLHFCIMHCFTLTVLLALATTWYHVGELRGKLQVEELRTQEQKAYVLELHDYARNLHVRMAALEHQHYVGVLSEFVHGVETIHAMENDALDTVEFMWRNLLFGRPPRPVPVNN
jgi:hypothetical protein